MEDKRKEQLQMGIIEEREKRVQWFMDARFGMFIHWGLYAIPGRGEWVMGDEEIDTPVYEKYFEEWNQITIIRNNGRKQLKMQV